MSRIADSSKLVRHASSRMRMVLCCLWMAGFMLAMVGGLAFGDSKSGSPQAVTAPPAEPPKAAAEPKAYEQTLPETTVSFKMMPVAGDGKNIKPFYMSATEVTWDMYDLYAFANVTPESGSPKGADAVTGPSKPYLPP